MHTFSFTAHHPLRLKLDLQFKMGITLAYWGHRDQYQAPPQSNPPWWQNTAPKWLSLYSFQRLPTSNVALFVTHGKRCITFPERTSTMFLTASRFLAMRSTSGSGAAGPAEAQMAWFGHPAQAAAWKAKVHGFRRNCSTEVYFATLFCPSARASLWRWFY